MNDSHSNSAPIPGAGARLFVMTAFVALVLSSLMLAGRSHFLLEDSMSGHGQAWATLLLLGFGLSAVFGVIYWALPCVFGVPLFCGRSVFLHYILHLVGVLLALVGTFVAALSNAKIASILLACGGVVFIFNVSLTLRRLKASDPAAAFLTTTMVFLAAAFVMGVPFASQPIATFFAEANWGVGWVVLITTGVLFGTLLGLLLRLMPLLMGEGEPRISGAWSAFLLLTIGAAWMFAATTFGPLSFMLFCGGIFFVGTLFYLGCFWGILQRRTKVLLSWETKILMGVPWMIAGSALIFIYGVWHRLSLPAPEAITEAIEPVAAAATTALKVLPMDWTVGLFALLMAAVPGFVALIFQLQKLQAQTKSEAILPSRPRTADYVLLASFFNYAVGAALVIVGVWGSEAQMLSLGTIFLVVGAAGFFGSYLYNRRCYSKLHRR